jgi:alkyl sulfatase BDS1-like metallo-beta-lactamase superfamily hydrolase
VNQNIVLGQITALRNQYATGLFLPDEGPDKNNLGDISKNISSTITYVSPTDTFSDKLDLDISGVKMTLMHIGDKSSDQIYVWLQDDVSLVIGDSIYGIFPNTSVLRGNPYHDPMSYVATLDKIILMEPEYLILSHVKPVIGKEDVKNNLISTRDATQYLHDQTIRGMNMGYTVDELANTIKFPPSLENDPSLTYQKGQIPWIVKQIYYGFFGGVEYDSIFSQSLSQDKRSTKIINGFGGVENVLLEVRKAIENNEYEWAAELATYVLHVEPENTEAKLLKAHALRILGQKTLSFDVRHIALTNALELEGKIAINSDDSLQMSSDQIAEIPIEKLLYALPTKFKSDKLGNVRAHMGIYYPDVDKGFILQFRNNVLIITESDNIRDYNVIMDTKIHKAIMSGELKLIDAINSKQIELKGDTNNILYLMGLIQEDSEGIPVKYLT